MLLPLKPLFKKAYLAWDPSEKCLRYVKWSEALAATCACYGLSYYLSSSKIEPKLEREIQALATPTFGTFLSTLKLFKNEVVSTIPLSLGRFLAFGYDSRAYPKIGPSVEKLHSIFSLGKIDLNKLVTTDLLETLLGARNRGLGHGGVPQTEETLAVEEICKCLETTCSNQLKASMLAITDIRADELHPGKFMERGIRWDDDGEHPWEEQRSREELIPLKRLCFLHKGILVQAPPFLQIDQGSFWFLQKYRRGGKSLFTDFEGTQSKSDAYWDDHLRSFLEGRFERAGRTTVQISLTGVYHDLPEETEAYTKFIGREKDLESLALQLSPARRTHIVALGGVGGVGKTALARSFVESITKSPDSIRHFDYVVWVSAKTSILKEEIEPLVPGFADIEDVLDEIARVADSPELIYQRPFERKKEQILGLLADGRFLLAIDNFETVKRKPAFWDFLLEIPAPSKALVTSRETFSEGCITIQVLELGEKEALEVFQNECRNLDVSDSKMLLSQRNKEQLIQRTGGIPLALKHIAILLARGYGLSDALQKLSGKQGPIADFCFRETFKILDKIEKTTWIALGIFERPVAVGELVQITGLSETELLNSLNTLKTYTIVNRATDGEGFQEFSCLPLTLEFAKKEAENWLPASEMMHRYKQYRTVIARAGVEDSRSEAGRIIKESGAVHPRLVARELAKRAMTLYRSGDVLEAMELIKSAERVDPGEKSVWEVKAEIEMGEFEFDLARDSYIKLLTFSRYDLNALRQLAFIEKRLEHWDQAIEYGRRVTQLPGATKKDWHILGNMYYRNGRVEWEKGNRTKREAALLEAVECLKAAFYPNPSSYAEKKHNVVACDTLARTYKYLGRQQDAEETILKGLDWEPYSSMLLDLQLSLLDRQRH